MKEWLAILELDEWIGRGKESHGKGRVPSGQAQTLSTYLTSLAYLSFEHLKVEGAASRSSERFMLSVRLP